jgi:hypothetical protein
MKRRTVMLAKQRGLLRGQSTTRSGPLLRSVPVFFGSWSSKGPGHGQVDTVVHSGPKLMGTMVYTVNYINVATYWQEPVAQLNKTDELHCKVSVLLPSGYRGSSKDCIRTAAMSSLMRRLLPGANASTLCSQEVVPTKRMTTVMLNNATWSLSGSMLGMNGTTARRQSMS